MRKSTALLIAVLFMSLALAVLFLLGGTLFAKLEVVTASAADYPQAFKSIREVLDSGVAPQMFARVESLDPSNCRLEDVTIQLRNRGLFAAEWLYVEVEGAPGDIAVYSISGEGGNVPPRSASTMNLKLIADARGSGARTYHIQYYVYGMKRTITVRQSEPQG